MTVPLASGGRSRREPEVAGSQRGRQRRRAAPCLGTRLRDLQEHGIIAWPRRSRERSRANGFSRLSKMQTVGFAPAPARASHILPGVPGPSRFERSIGKEQHGGETHLASPGWSCCECASEFTDETVQAAAQALKRYGTYRRSKSERKHPADWANLASREGTEAGGSVLPNIECFERAVWQGNLQFGVCP